MHLKDWISLCSAKSKGEIGLRKLEEMNKVLLGKQAWRMITKLEALVASNLLHKYYKNEQFTQVKAKHGNSWIWKSLLFGRDVIIKGIDIQVWSGKQTSFSAGAFDFNNNAPNLIGHMCPYSHTWKIVDRHNNDRNIVF